jgi:DMSO/TMAO reductase YedYZ molybdopterin-dependent catalytic subunit
MMSAIRTACFAWMLSCFAPALAAQAIELRGEFATPFALDAQALRAMSRVKTSTNDHGRQGMWEGVHLREVLARAGAPLGADLRGRATATVVIVGAADGYRSVFALAEFDPAFGHLDAILADTRDGRPLDAKEGPYRLVLPTHKRQTRSVRQVTWIELRTLP